MKDTTTLQRNKDILSSSVNNETVMMDIETGQYIGLDPIATRIWELLEQPTNFSQLCETLTKEYEVSIEQCRNDVAQFINKSIEANLITANAA